VTLACCRHLFGIAASCALASCSERPFDDRPRAMNDAYECA
jgi:hypothetical protein